MTVLISVAVGSPSNYAACVELLSSWSPVKLNCVYLKRHALKLLIALDLFVVNI